MGAPSQIGGGPAQATMGRQVEISLAQHLLTAPGEAVQVSLQACILTIEFVDKLACSTADLSGDQVEATRTILDLRETEPGPMTSMEMLGVFDGFLSGFRLGSAINNAAIEIGDHYPSFHVEKSGNTVIDQVRLSAWTAELLKSRGVVSRTLRRTCKGELFTSNLLGFEEVFALKASTGFEFSNPVNEYKSTFCELAASVARPPAQAW